MLAFASKPVAAKIINIDPEKYVFMGWILSDDEFARESVTGRVFSRRFNDYFNRGADAKYFGHALCIMPFETFTSLNPTTPIGMTSGLMISLSFQLKKWEFVSQKVDEWIEVNPT